MSAIRRCSRLQGRTEASLYAGRRQLESVPQSNNCPHETDRQPFGEHDNHGGIYCGLPHRDTWCFVMLEKQTVMTSVGSCARSLTKVHIDDVQYEPLSSSRLPVSVGSFKRNWECFWKRIFLCAHARSARSTTPTYRHVCRSWRRLSRNCSTRVPDREAWWL